jgi:hypothetical protein
LKISSKHLKHHEIYRQKTHFMLEVKAIILIYKYHGRIKLIKLN